MPAARRMALSPRCPDRIDSLHCCTRQGQTMDWGQSVLQVQRPHQPRQILARRADLFRDLCRPGDFRLRDRRQRDLSGHQRHAEHRDLHLEPRRRREAPARPQQVRLVPGAVLYRARHSGDGRHRGRHGHGGFHRDRQHPRTGGVRHRRLGFRRAGLPARHHRRQPVRPRSACRRRPCRRCGRRPEP